MKGAAAGGPPRRVPRGSPQPERGCDFSFESSRFFVAPSHRFRRVARSSCRNLVLHERVNAPCGRGPPRLQRRCSLNVVAVVRHAIEVAVVAAGLVRARALAVLAVALVVKSPPRERHARRSQRPRRPRRQRTLRSETMCAKADGHAGAVPEVRDCRAEEHWQHAQQSPRAPCQAHGLDASVRPPNS
eukprot:scaffold13599_cov61-Phaeocystis_antarctica.AAC.1